MANTTQLPTAPKSFFTIRKARHGFEVVLATPAGRRTLRTALVRCADRETAIAKGREIAAMRQRPFKLGGRV